MVHVTDYLTIVLRAKIINQMKSQSTVMMLFSNGFLKLVKKRMKTMIISKVFCLTFSHAIIYLFILLSFVQSIKHSAVTVDYFVMFLRLWLLIFAAYLSFKLNCNRDTHVVYLLVALSAAWSRGLYGNQNNERKVDENIFLIISLS